MAIGDKDASVLGCYRIEDIDEPTTPSVVDACVICHKGVWRGLASPQTDYILCIHCLITEIKDRELKARGDKIRIMPPTAAQRAAIKKACE